MEVLPWTVGNPIITAYVSGHATLRAGAARPQIESRTWGRELSTLGLFFLLMLS